MVNENEDSLASTPANPPSSMGGSDSLDQSLQSPEVDGSMEDSPQKSNNPFNLNVGGDSATATPTSTPSFQYQRTRITNSELIKYPFKTLNRILNDLIWTVPMRDQYNISLLNSKPIDYSDGLCRVINSVPRFQSLILNNSLDFCPSLESHSLDDRQQTLYIIRGLLVDNDQQKVYHFRISALENNSNPFLATPIDKHQYHIIPKELISKHDLQALRADYPDSDLKIDDAFFKSLNSPNNQLLRVTLYNPEFSSEDLDSLASQSIITKRYMKGIEKHPNLSPDTIPNAVHCFKTLIKVLKGPVLLKPDDPIKTISLKNTVLDAQIDVKLLYEKLGFTLDAEKEDAVPPNLNLLPGLKEAYIRKILELIHWGLVISKKVPSIEFEALYSFSNNMSLVFQTIVEYDKHASMTNFNSKYTEKFPYFINLSISSYFQDELIIKCFENTVQSDPANKLHYVDSLKETRRMKNSIAPSRKLDAYLRNLENQGELVGFYDYVEAMKTIGLSIANKDEIDSIDDEVVIAMYRTQYRSDPKNYQYYNNLVRVIAKARNSTNLLNFLQREVIPMGMALDELNIEEVTEDEVVITAYEFKLDDLLQQNNLNANSTDIIYLHKALVSVAVHRKSYLLLNYLETKLPEFTKLNEMEDITTASAYSFFNLTPNTSDFDAITYFQNAIVDPNQQADIRLLRYCLKLIAESRKSDIIFSFLKTGKIDASLLPAENWPAGLDNIGNTCYLNSLLQYYFCIKPLRELILCYNEKDFDLTQFETRKIGGRKIEELEIKRATQFIYHLKYLFDEMIHTNKRCVQPSKELAYLSFLPLSQPVNFHVDVMEPEVVYVGTDTDANMESTDEVEMVVEETSSNDIKQMEEDVETPETSDVEEDSTEEQTKLLPISNDQMESTIEVGRQQDVTECIENVTFQIETVLPPDKMDKDGEQYDLIKKLFYGKTKQTISPLDKPDGDSRVSLELFFSLIINVSDHPKSIYDALDYYFNEDVVKLDGGLFKRSITISELPDILQFHVQRVLFDREKLMAYKSIEPIPFSEKIYLDRYLDTDDEEILSKREEVFKWKREISELMEMKKKILHVDEETGLSIISTLQTTKKYLEAKIIQDEKLSIELSTIQVLQQEIDNLKGQLLEIDTRLAILNKKVSKQFENYRSIGYSIFAIFIHRGEASYGHYWVYIKDPHQKNVFRKYNDETVTEVPSSEVFNFVEGNTATPYYIVYVKDNLEYDYIEPLKREIS
ncbi:UBP2 [[Candida] subhashii]|uniref:Ubiquitin carboxyl-terminal hydrolase 2 n=1 Tax=[Candida] subhashii TaxID=561895 RepID=A0A8J5UJ80_9ASCO|nr:UBP2 [[Candida] subhashii]KAG7661592.1 UBP2 [[Candida] subhashii]